jgi:hypothetical protein
MKLTTDELYEITDCLLYRKYYIRTHIDKGAYYDVDKGLKEIAEIEIILDKLSKQVAKEVLENE